MKKLMKPSVAILITVIFLLRLTVQHGLAGTRPAGARSAGMAGISSCLCDTWSGGNNQAGNAWNHGLSCGFSAENLYMLDDLSYCNLTLSASFKPGAFALVLRHFGGKEYNEIFGGVSYSRKFGKHFSAGIQLDYYRYSFAAGYGSRSLVNCEAGMMYRPGSHVTLGFHIVNPVPVRLGSAGQETLPVLLLLGLTYHFTPDLLLAAEYEKNPQGPGCFRMAGECRFAHVLSARAGISTSPLRMSLGTGIIIGRLSFDLASEYNQMLGFSPAISVQYLLRK